MNIFSIYIYIQLSNNLDKSSLGGDKNLGMQNNRKARIIFFGFAICLIACADEWFSI